MIHRIGKMKNGGMASAESAPAAEGDSPSPPAPGEDDRVCQAIHGLRRFVPPIRSPLVADGCAGQNQGDGRDARSQRGWLREKGQRPTATK